MGPVHRESFSRTRPGSSQPPKIRTFPQYTPVADRAAVSNTHDLGITQFISLPVHSDNFYGSSMQLRTSILGLSKRSWADREKD